jgi:hypothetical protein
MRNILMAGSALMLMSGIAFAQTTAATPNPSMGMNNNAVAGQTPGTASGNMATNSGGMAAPDAAGTNSSGMNNTGVTGQLPGATKGNMAATPGAMDHSTTGDQLIPKQRQSTMRKSMMHHSSMMDHGMMHHGMMDHGTMDHGMMPENGSAGQYLHMAQHSVMSHDKTRATEELGRAETNLLTNSYVQGSVNGPISTPAISAIRDARKDVGDGDYTGASMMIHKAMMAMHGGMMDHGGMGHDSMGHMGHMGHMSNTGMNHDNMGNMPAKQDSSMAKP